MPALWRLPAHSFYGQARSQPQTPFLHLRSCSMMMEILTWRKGRRRQTEQSDTQVLRATNMCRVCAVVPARCSAFDQWRRHSRRVFRGRGHAECSNRVYIRISSQLDLAPKEVPITLINRNMLVSFRHVGRHSKGFFLPAAIYPALRVSGLGNWRAACPSVHGHTMGPIEQYSCGDTAVWLILAQRAQGCHHKFRESPPGF